MSSKEFCESGKHVYQERDLVVSLFENEGDYHAVWIVVACNKCDSKFLRMVEKPIL